MGSNLPAPGRWNRVDDLVHVPATPTWDCTGCREPWPCSNRRTRLLAQYDGARMSLYLTMAMKLCDAAGDLREVPAGELHDRFLGWVRRAYRIEMRHPQQDRVGWS